MMMSRPARAEQILFCWSSRVVVGGGAEQLQLSLLSLSFRACRLKSMTGLIRSLCSFIMIIIAALRCDSTRQGSLRIRGDGQGRLIQHQNVFLCWCMYNRYIHTNIGLSFTCLVYLVVGILFVNIFIDADHTGLRDGWPPGSSHSTPRPQKLILIHKLRSTRQN